MNQYGRVDKCSADFRMISLVVLPSSRSTACYSVKSSSLYSTINYASCKTFYLCEKILTVYKREKFTLPCDLGLCFLYTVVCGFMKTKCITVGESGLMTAHLILGMGKELGPFIPLKDTFNLSSLYCALPFKISTTSH